MSNLKTNAGEVFTWLMENNYLEGAGTPTGNQLNRQFFHDAGKILDCSALPVPVKTVVQLPATKEDWDRKFIDFIIKAQVPARLEGSRNEVYYANKFSEAGLKAFRKALESGVDESLLVKSVTLYYKSNVKFKKAVGNYFSQGDWRSDYEALATAVEQGAEELTKHITDEIKPTDGQRSNYTLG